MQFIELRVYPRFATFVSKINTGKTKSFCVNGTYSSVAVHDGMKSVGYVVDSGTKTTVVKGSRSISGQFIKSEGGFVHIRTEDGIASIANPDIVYDTRGPDTVTLTGDVKIATVMCNTSNVSWSPSLLAIFRRDELCLTLRGTIFNFIHPGCSNAKLLSNCNVKLFRNSAFLPREPKLWRRISSSDPDFNDNLDISAGETTINIKSSTVKYSVEKIARISGHTISPIITAVFKLPFDIPRLTFDIVDSGNRGSFKSTTAGPLYAGDGVGVALGCDTSIIVRTNSQRVADVEKNLYRITIIAERMAVEESEENCALVIYFPLNGCELRSDGGFGATVERDCARFVVNLMKTDLRRIEFVTFGNPLTNETRNKFAPLGPYII